MPRRPICSTIAIVQHLQRQSQAQIRPIFYCSCKSGLICFYQSPITQTPMFDKPAYKTMVICLLKGDLLSILLLQLDQLKSLVYSETLVQEGINDQINVLLLHVPVLLNFASIYVYTRGARTYITQALHVHDRGPLTPAISILATQKQGRPHHCSFPILIIVDNKDRRS